VVWSEWLDECIDAGGRVDEEPFTWCEGGKRPKRNGKEDRGVYRLVTF
jgi:hypothetical protein